MTRFWRHKKRRTHYAEVGIAELQISSGSLLQEGDLLTVYLSSSGALYVRPRGEFLDGRFEPVRVKGKVGL